MVGWAFSEGRHNVTMTCGPNCVCGHLYLLTASKHVILQFAIF